MISAQDEPLFLFLALNFDSQTKEELRGIAERLSKQSVSGKFTAKENFHITLVFIGNTDKKKIPLIIEAMDSAAAEQKQFSLELGGLGRFNNAGGDIWWYGVGLNPELKELNLSLSEKLRRGGFDIETRGYRPHITLGRGVVLNPGFIKPDFEKALPHLKVPVGRISLMKSDRIRGAVRYAEIYGNNLIM